MFEKTNEIAVFQEMLESIDIKDKIITADALHCQKSTCKKIIKKDGGYIFGLKENQKNFYSDIKLFIESEINNKDLECFSTTEKNGGRIETRICYKVNNIEWFEYKEEWAGLSTVFAIKRITETKYGKSEVFSFYITSISETAKNLLKYVREHWKIESLHWPLDVVFSEDNSKIISKNGLKTLNIFRKLAVLAHKKFILTLLKKKALKTMFLIVCLMMIG